MNFTQRNWVERVSSLPLEMFSLPPEVEKTLPNAPDGYDYRVYLRESLAQTEVGGRSVRNQCIEAWREHLAGFDWTAKWFEEAALQIENRLNLEEKSGAPVYAVQRG